jgi:ferric-dicitrate binding protein FerR (iron transport regulator)
MKRLPEEWNDLPALCSAAVEDRLTAEQRDRLEEIVMRHPAARRYYVEYLHQHASLAWSMADPALLNVDQPAQRPPLRVHRPRRPLHRWLLTGGLAAAVLIAAGLWFALRPSAVTVPPSVATLVSGKACKWEAGSLPTETGARLAAGRLRLAEGLARITFDSGAEVTLEAPADLELVSSKRCVLHAGRLVAKVPPQAHGFVVDTPTAVLTDLGTEFGVHVRDACTADVQVFNGLVDVRHRASGKTERIETGRNLRVRSDRIADFDPLTERPNAPRSDAAGRAVHISTAMGRGKDAYVQPLFPIKTHTDTLLLVKNTVPEKSDYDRKAYIGLDLAPLAGRQVVDAQLSFTFTPTGLGFASEVPDATFTVYGLTDESLDDWDEQAIRWPSAPANRDGGTGLDPERVVLLGTFEIVQGELSGSRSISGQALLDFLKQDTNGLVTFILVRETLGSGRNDLVHGFASKEHPTLPPPTLKLTVAP